MKKLFAVLVVIALVASVASAQLKAGAFGIQTSVIGNNGAFGGVYNLSENMRIGANVGFESTSPSGGTSSSTFRIGGGVAHYFNTAENLSTFAGATISFSSSSSGGTTSTGFGLNVQYGAEYWFSQRFSISGFLQAGYSSNGPSGATTSSLTTSTGTALTFYLK
jgi:hypothetical protein